MTYELLTDYIEPLSSEKSHGKLHTFPVVSNTMQMPFIEYSKLSMDFMNSVYDFIKSHEDFNLYNYSDILDQMHIKQTGETFRTIDLQKLDGRTIMAMIVSVIRTDRFCDGLYLEFLDSGFFVRCLKRLKEIDEEVADA